MSKPESGLVSGEVDPRTEGINNFYSHMPGGLYRADFADDGVNGAVRKCVETYGRFFDEPREAWPEDKVSFIESLKVVVEIQKAIDVFLVENTRISGWWEDWHAEYSPSLDPQKKSVIENQILRPVYVAMRERGFSQEQLTS